VCSWSCLRLSCHSHLPRRLDCLDSLRHRRRSCLLRSLCSAFPSSSADWTALHSSFFVVYTREPRGTRRPNAALPPSGPPSWAPAASKAPTARADWSTSTRTARYELLTALLPPPRRRKQSEPTAPPRPPVLVPAPRLCHASRPSITTRTSTTRVLVTSYSIRGS
jgi:hypothetical protein